MDIDTNYLSLGSIDSTTCITKLSHVDWDEWTHRQDKFIHHKKTKSIPMYWSTNEIGSDITFHKHNCQLFAQELNLLKGLIEYYYNCKMFYTKAIIVKLNGESFIPRHWDSAEIFSITHRVHWCIDGDFNKLDFCVDSGTEEISKDLERLNLSKNDVIEINNIRCHSVTYQGEQPRIHMISDFVSEERYKKYWK